VQWETEGLTQFEIFYGYVYNLQHVKRLSGLELELKLLKHDSQIVFRHYKSVLKEIFWGTKYRTIQKDLFNGATFDSQVIKFEAESDYSFSIDQRYTLTYASGETSLNTLNEEFLISQMCLNKELFTDIGKEMCIALDVALGGGGCEAVVEGFYSLVKVHKKNGGQLNSSLCERAIVD